MYLLELRPEMHLTAPAEGELSVLEQVAKRERDADLHPKELLRRLIDLQLAENEALPRWFPADASNPDTIFASYLKTDSFKQAYARLEQLAKKGRVPTQKKREFKGRVHADISEASAQALVDTYAPGRNVVLLSEQKTRRLYLRLARERGLVVTPTTYDFHEGIRGISVPDGAIATVDDDPEIVALTEYTSFKSPERLQAQCDAYQSTIDKLKERGSFKGELFADHPPVMVVTTKVLNPWYISDMRKASPNASIAWNYHPWDVGDFVDMAAQTIRSGVTTKNGIGAMQAYYTERSSNPQ